MELRLLPEAAAHLTRLGVRALTVEAFVVAGCCAPDLPPVVHPGPPRDPGGFRRVEVDGVTVYLDPLLELPPRLTIGVRHHRLGGAELAVVDWPADGRPHPAEA